MKYLFTVLLMCGMAHAADKCRVAWDNQPSTILSGHSDTEISHFNWELRLPLVSGHGEWSDCGLAKLAAEESARPELRTYLEIHRCFPHHNRKYLVPVREVSR